MLPGLHGLTCPKMQMPWLQNLSVGALQGPVDAAGSCCANGIVDTFGVCDGYDTSGAFNITATLAASDTASAQTALASLLGISSSSLSSATM